MDRAAITAALAKVEAAKESCDLVALKAALQEARVAGAPTAFIDQAFAEIRELEKEASITPEAAAPAASTTQGADEAKKPTFTYKGSSSTETEAREWKDRGNAKLKEGQDKATLTAAMNCYTSGLAVRGLTHKTLMAQLYGNRGHVQTLLHMFAEAVDDCRKSLDLDPSNAKVYWRAARASLLNGLGRQALEFCDRGLSEFPDNVDLGKMRTQCLAKLDKPKRANPQEAMDTQDRVNQLREQTMSCAMQIQSKELRKRQSELTLAEMEALPEETRTFAACGRAFLLTPQSTVKEKLRAAVTTVNEELPKLIKARDELDKRREGAEKELEEIVQTFR